MKVQGREGSQIVLDVNIVWPSEADFILGIKTRTKLSLKAEVHHIAATVQYSRAQDCTLPDYRGVLGEDAHARARYHAIQYCSPFDCILIRWNPRR